MHTNYLCFLACQCKCANWPIHLPFPAPRTGTISNQSRPSEFLASRNALDCTHLQSLANRDALDCSHFLGLGGYLAWWVLATFRWRISFSPPPFPTELSHQGWKHNSTLQSMVSIFLDSPHLQGSCRTEATCTYRTVSESHVRKVEFVRYFISLFARSLKATEGKHFKHLWIIHIT